MTLLEMSLSGGVLILAITVLRSLALNRLPKRTFPALWALAAARLLLPFSLPSPLSVWSLVQTPISPEVMAAGTTGFTAPVLPPAASQHLPSAAASPAGGADFPVWTAVWLGGMSLCAAFFLVSYLRCRRSFRSARPVEEMPHGVLRRKISIRQSENIHAPLTYGVVRPVILLPASTDWQDRGRLAYVLEHELVHIRRFDGVFKLLLTAAACVHWFNPLAWAMLALAGRDIELSCDEAVIRRLGIERRKAYAMTLIAMEEQKSGLGPFANAFSKNAIEERIVAIMKMKKTSLLALMLAVVLVCGMGMAFATSAQAKEDLRSYLTEIPNYTSEESRQLFSLWFEGYEDMTVADYREKMRSERGDGEFMELIQRFSLDGAAYQLPAGKEADALAAFNDYFFNVYEPLTADQWQTRSFDGIGANGAEYQYDLTILDPDALTVEQYEQTRQEVETALRQPMDDASGAFAVEDLSTQTLRVELGYYAASFRSEDESDAALHAQFSDEAAADWDRLLTPYLPFGLTYAFDDPDHDGNGLTMWFDGKVVRGIFDEQEGLWITEHAGNTWPRGAVELYAVYSNGKLSGLRLADEEEQAAFTQDRIQTSEQREFPRATQADYDSFLALQWPGTSGARDARELPLEVFNQRLLDWANENSDAYDRINCDVIRNDYGVELAPVERSFVSVTCLLSGTENGMVIRAFHTNDPEQDPGFSANLPFRTLEVDGVTAAWCDLYYDISYHVSDKSQVTVAERDACVGGMMNAISTFWQDTDFEVLVSMTEQDVVDQFNLWAEQCSGNGIAINPVTADNIHFEHLDERSILHY